MAGAMRKLGLYLGLVPDGEADGYYEDDRDRGYYEDYEEPAPTRSERGPVRRFDADRGGEPMTRGALALDEQPVHMPADPAEREYRITTFHPRNYNEARAIGERYREGTPVIMNLTEMDDADAKRLVDFAAGLSFALQGTLERITNKVFLVSPPDVAVTAEDKARIAEDGFFNQS